MTWAFTDHACRFCLGTVMQSGTTFICSICRATAEGSPHAICGCGCTISGPAGPRSAGLRCVVNASPSPACPAHVVIALAPVAETPKAA